MNDTELDRLLNAWKSPDPPPSLRKGLRARFPRAERRSIWRPVRWTLAIAALSGILALGMERTGDVAEFRFMRILSHFHDHIRSAFESWHASGLVDRIQQSDPKVYVDGRLAGSMERGHAATIDVQVPGEGLFSIAWHRGGMEGWTAAGSMHGSVIEFQAGNKDVRIECNQQITDSETRVFAIKR